MAGSFDIQPRRVSAQAPKPVAPRPIEPVRPAPTRSIPTRREAIRRDPAPSAPRTPLKKKRKARRRKLITLLGVGALVLFIGIVVLLWQPFLRVETITAEGPSADGIKALAAEDLKGTRYLILPRNSIFFLPIEKLRSHILVSYPDIQAVSIAPSGLTALHIQTTGRITAFWWCGTSYLAPESACYQTDSDGLIFATVPVDQIVASTSELWIYSPLASPPSTASSSPVGSTLKSPALIPGVLSFVKALRVLQVDVRSVDMRSDEADIYTAGGTRITYVMGKEQQAANLASAAFPKLNLNDGSLLYVDLRFESKVFFKKKGQ